MAVPPKKANVADQMFNLTFSVEGREGEVGQLWLQLALAAELVAG